MREPLPPTPTPTPTQLPSTASLVPPHSLCKEGGEEASLLCNCVFGGEFGLLRRLLRAGAHVDQGDYDLRTALHIAAGGGGRQAGGLSAALFGLAVCVWGEAKQTEGSCRSFWGGQRDGRARCLLPAPPQPRATCLRWSCWSMRGMPTPLCATGAPCRLAGVGPRALCCRSHVQPQQLACGTDGLIKTTGRKHVAACTWRVVAQADDAWLLGLAGGATRRWARLVAWAPRRCAPSWSGQRPVRRPRKPAPRLRELAPPLDSNVSINECMRLLITIISLALRLLPC